MVSILQVRDGHSYIFISLKIPIQDKHRISKIGRECYYHYENRLCSLIMGLKTEERCPNTPVRPLLTSLTKNQRTFTNCVLQTDV